MNCCGHTLEGVKFRNEKNKNFFEFIFWWIYLSQHKKAGGKLCVLVRIWKLMTIERRRILTKAFIEFAWLLSSCGCSLRNSDAKYVGNNMPRRFQNFSVCLGNNSAKKKKKNAEDSAETFVHYIGNGFGIPRHFTKGYDLFF